MILAAAGERPGPGARFLYEPFMPWLAELADGNPPTLDQLVRWLDATQPRPASGAGQPLRFVPPLPEGLPYEQVIHRDGAVPTRPDNWHDAFNALVWLRFPLTKAALNARHVREQRPDGIRGAARDAATLFDESGVIVLATDRSLLAALRGHRWREAFVTRRDALRGSVRFVVFGHALLDQLRAPYYGLCGKALHLDMPGGLPDGPAFFADLDAKLAAAFDEPGFMASPGALHPLPMLGIPGLAPENENPAYYDDERQFRPARRGKTRA